MTTTDWRSRAACLSEDPELFFPNGTTGPSLLQIEEARDICAACPVQKACLDTAMDFEGGAGRDSRHGMWGALHDQERHNLYTRANKRRRRAAS